MRFNLSVDIRYLQIVAMAFLLGFGIFFRDFNLRPAQIALTFAVGLTVQWGWLHSFNVPRKEYLSALISCFGISLLLRSSGDFAHPVAITLAISSKFLLRYRNRHIFNPANLGVAAAIGLLPATWVSSGQWGTETTTVLLLAVLGSVIAASSRSLDASLTFLAAYLGIFYAVRIVGYGYPIGVLWHQLQNGGLLLFAFFMITDPVTLPVHRAGRMIHALLVAAITFVGQTVYYWNQSFIWALLLASPLTPLWNQLFPYPAFQWTKTPAGDLP